MGTDLIWRTDSHLRDSVQYQLEREFDVNPADVGITATDGAVTLTGFVHTLAEKLAAEQAAKRVLGVTAVANEIQVTPDSESTDAEIARDAVQALRMQTYVPKDICVTVSDGFVTLEGTVTRQFQREAAEAAVRYLKGVRGLWRSCACNSLEPKQQRWLRRRANRSNFGARDRSILMNNHRKLTGTLVLVACLGSSVVSGQVPPLKRVMRQKLEQSQLILGAVVTSDWAALERHSRELERLTSEPAWAVLKTPEYARQSTAFLHATQDLVKAATDHDLEAAPLAYVSLTLSCVQCHRYVAKARLAR